MRNLIHDEVRAHRQAAMVAAPTGASLDADLVNSNRRGKGAGCAKRRGYLARVSEFISTPPGLPATPLFGARLDRSDPSPPHRPGRRGRCNTCLLYTSPSPRD